MKKLISAILISFAMLSQAQAEIAYTCYRADQADDWVLTVFLESHVAQLWDSHGYSEFSLQYITKDGGRVYIFVENQAPQNYIDFYELGDRTGEALYFNAYSEGEPLWMTCELEEHFG